jgi:Arc/MetJ-type ribon-helix-helix transcriptional regulator
MANILVNFRFEPNLLKEIDKVIKEGLYSNRTEFIKTAVRNELSDYQKKKLIKSLHSKLSEGKRLGLKEPTEEEMEAIREKVWNKLYEKD